MISMSGVDLFLEDLKRQCKQHKIKLIFGRGRTVLIEGSIRSTGYFDSGERELAIGKNRPDWLQLLVHESCHIDQWVENTKVWRDEDKLGNDVLDKWLLGKDFDRRKVKRALNNIIRLELDCERRAIQKISEYDLPINTCTYIQKANAYLFYHHRVFQKRLWQPGVYESTIITNAMPNKMLSNDSYLRMPNKLEKYFIAGGF